MADVEKKKTKYLRFKERGWSHEGGAGLIIFLRSHGIVSAQQTGHVTFVYIC